MIGKLTNINCGPSIFTGSLSFSETGANYYIKEVNMNITEINHRN